MGLARFVLKRPVATVMALLCLLIFDISSAFNATLERMSDTNQPMLVTIAPHSETGSENIDELVIQPIENQVETIEGMKSMSSTSSENRAMIMLEYDYGTDMDDAYNDLSQSLDVLNRQLPDDAETSVMEMNNNAGTAMMLSISDPSREDLHDHVDQTTVPLLERISPMTRVETMSGKLEYYKIELRSDEMAQYQVTISDVSTAMSTTNLSYPSGDAVPGKLELSASTPLEHKTIEALKEVPITTSSEKIAYLGDIAKVHEAEESRGGISRYNGQDTISISTIRQQNSTTIDAPSEVQEVIESLEADDENLNIRIVRDSAGSVLSSPKDVVFTLVLAAVVPMIIIFVFLGDYKASLTVGSSIPTSILVSLILMTSADFSLNIITTSGLMLGVDMMVGNSTVVLESCFRVIETEEDRGLLGYTRASLLGTNTVLQSILGSTVTTYMVFPPLAFLWGISGRMFDSIGHVVVFCMLTSFLLAITIVPLTYMAYKPQERMQAPMSRPIEQIQSEYHRTIPGLLNHKAVIMIASVILAIAVYFLASGIETELITADDTGTVSVSIETGSGLLPENTDAMLPQAEGIVQGHPDAESYMPRCNNDSGTITAYLRDNGDMNTNEIVEQWETEMADLDNCTVAVETSSSMSLMNRNQGYEVILNGTDYDGLQEVSNEIITEMTTRDDVVNVHSSIGNTASVVTVRVDPVPAATEGLIASQAGSRVKQMMDGEEVAILNVGGREVSVMIEYPEDEYRMVSQMKGIVLSRPFGDYVTLTNVAEIYYRDSPTSISKMDRVYEITITANYTGGNVQSAVDSEVINPNLGDTIKRGVNSMNRMMQEEFTASYQMIAVAVFPVFVVLSAQFELPKFSFMVMTTIPFSFIGSLGFLQITGAGISMTSILGFLVLVGTVVNNGIPHVDTVNQCRITMDLKTTLIETGATCLRPIMMTSLTTILSMIPMALATGDGGSTAQGLAIVNVGGPSVGVAMTLFILPVYYAFVNGDKKWVVLDIQKRGANHTEYGKIGVGYLAVVLCLGTIPVTAWTGTPELVYAVEQWVSLRDNQLEPTEVADLIYVYSNAVIRNQLEYEDFRDENAGDIVDDHYGAADNIYGSLEYPDSSDSDYVSRLSSYLSSQIWTDNLREQGDDNVEGRDVKKLEYDKTEAGLMKEAQELMVSYWSQMCSPESLEQNKIQARSSYDRTLNHPSAGMSTQVQVLLAREAATSADVSLLSARSSLGRVKKTLCLMLGWTYGAQVDIGGVPEPDLEGMTAINLGEDVSRGVENNYSLKILEEKIVNAKNGTNKTSLEQSLKGQKETVASNIKDTCESTMMSRSGYEQALNTYEVEAVAMVAAEREMAARTTIKNDYVAQQTTSAAVQVNMRTQKLALLKAQLEYRWLVDRLASVLQDVSIWEVE